MSDGGIIKTADG